jgi:hypothetical protein
VQYAIYNSLSPSVFARLIRCGLPVAPRGISSRMWNTRGT